MTNDLIQLLLTLLPAIIVGAVAFYFFHTTSKTEESRRIFLLHRENQKTALPIKLQAYERMTLFLERISPGKILFRVKPVSEDANAYANLLVNTIEQEFEHNLAQQIYVTADCWDYIKTAKNATIGLVRKAASREEVENAGKLREVILNALMEKQAPTDAALAFIRKEVRKII
ncbi:hypothetical protein RM549_01850 [Salegentibacter sp. F188]|uniref:Uncharacterized protein n=1 Tax=Autumnicola patrickiae TaxID=3075591 RepID=A0ABU3DZM1_9FLAO|nr:hypothetical protein [Salegentibacter sp. F188]MDT0688512.1 hypothetical protein [Salegentibacter sp. F188]